MSSVTNKQVSDLNISLTDRIENLPLLKLFKLDKYKRELVSLHKLLTSAFGQNDVLQELHHFQKSYLRGARIGLAATFGASVATANIYYLYSVSSYLQNIVGFTAIFLIAGASVSSTATYAIKYYLRSRGAQILYNHINHTGKS